MRRTVIFACSLLWAWGLEG